MKTIIDENLHDICASIQNLIDNLLNKAGIFSSKKNILKIVFGGGVSANSYLKKRLYEESKENGWESFYSRNSIYYR